MTINSIKSLSSLPYFSREALSTVIGLDNHPRNLDTNILRWLSAGKIVSLKKGLYTTRENFERYRGESSYHELIAGILVYPSYISLEYVLRRHEILTDATHGITSVTTKIGRSFDNQLNSFTFRHIRSDLFTGFEVCEFLGQKYYMASRAKALFDFVYYKSRRMSKFEQDYNLVEDWRLNLEMFSSKDWRELSAYGKLANSKKIISIIKNLKKYASNHF